MFKTLAFAFSLCLAASGAAAQQQQSAATPDGFTGLTLGETTVEEAVAALGQPDTDKTDKLDVSKIEKWLDKRHSEKIFRRLSYTKSEILRKLELSFLDGKLVMIDLEFKKSYDPEKLPNLFAVNFALVGGPSPLPNKPGEYPRGFLATHFPAAYALIGISPKTFILANCESAGGGSSPGRVTRTRQISRALERK
ncbi:MAG TPA: hypothetical protein VK421_17395 [Pyrinomonadaceae bacterium]|nr:hypothetical protein [Pyrinomonadaceae bacterium]